MPKAIPEGLTREHVLKALDDLDSGIKHSFGNAKKFALVHNNKQYPPKAVVGVAFRHHIGRTLGRSEFSEGEKPGQATAVLRNLGFQVIANPNAVDDLLDISKKHNAKTSSKTGYAVITQNDMSQWDDTKGSSYHYPKRYAAILTPGCQIVYYKGQMKNAHYAGSRLSAKPHYFGVGIIGNSVLDQRSSKEDRFCEILDYQEFEKAVHAKTSGSYIEHIPENRKTNYWRDGVREISREIYDEICSNARLTDYSPRLPDSNKEEELESESFGQDGAEKGRYTTYYERKPFNRERAIEIHGLVCMACGIDFSEKYGEWGAGYIQVHHNKPISETGPMLINPETDLSVVCPNCHAMIHRKRGRTLTVEEVKALLSRDS